MFDFSVKTRLKKVLKKMYVIFHLYHYNIRPLDHNYPGLHFLVYIAIVFLLAARHYEIVLIHNYVKHIVIQ